MTERKVNFALKKISKCRESGCEHEAFIHSYLLNIGLIRYMFNYVSNDEQAKRKKAKALVHDFIDEISAHPEHKGIISKRNLKIVKPWIAKTDSYFKELRSGNAGNVKQLLEESEKIFALLNLSASKLFINSKPLPKRTARRAVHA